MKKIYWAVAKKKIGFLPEAYLSQRGFTLVEMLVAIAIIVILMAIMIPSFRMAKEKANCAVCINNLKQLGRGFALYMTENEGAWPANQFAEELGLSWGRWVLEVNTREKKSSGISHIDRDLYVCPSDPSPMSVTIYPSGYACVEGSDDVLLAKKESGLLELLFGGLAFAAQNKVAVCHVPPGDPANRHTIYIAEPAVHAHVPPQGLGYIGECSPDDGYGPMNDDDDDDDDGDGDGDNDGDDDGNGGGLIQIQCSYSYNKELCDRKIGYHDLAYSSETVILFDGNAIMQFQASLPEEPDYYSNVVSARHQGQGACCLFADFHVECNPDITNDNIIPTAR